MKRAGESRWRNWSLRLFCRQRVDAAIAWLPNWFFRGFFKTFTTRPELAERAGFHVHPRCFDSPLPLLEEVDRGRLKEPRTLPGIDLRVSEALGLARKLAPFSGELDEVPYDYVQGAQFWFNNQSYTDFDAAVLYCLLRWLKPRRYMELGCGFSSLVSSRALHRNLRDGVNCDAIYCDPEPRLAMDGTLAHGRFEKKRVQDLPLDWFCGLEPRDVLFIDTSHVLKIQSDVEHELLRILPSLKPGVWIHLHDVFTPYDYPEDWVYRPVRLAANEQYAVECLLSGGDRYRIELPVHYLVRHQLAAMQQLLPRGRERGQSFWIQKVC